MTKSCLNCPVCEEPVALGTSPCPACQRWLYWSANRQRVHSGLTALSLALVALLLVALLLLMAGLATDAAVMLELSLLAALLGVLAVDGWLSLRSGVDRTKARVAHGVEAKVTGLFKLALASAGLAICLYGLSVVPSLLNTVS